MLTTVDLLDLAKQHQGGVSDYRLAKLLGVSPTVVSNYRCKRSTPANPIAMHLGELAGLDPLAAVAAANAERSTSDSEKKVWVTLWDRLNGVHGAEYPHLQAYITPRM